MESTGANLTCNEYQNKVADTCLYRNKAREIVWGVIGDMATTLGIPREVALANPKAMQLTDLLCLMYVGLGLAGEAGEVTNKIKKVFRDDGGVLTDSKAKEIGKEVGGTQWYSGAACTELKTTLGAVSQANLDILADRKSRGTLQGSGDNR